MNTEGLLDSERSFIAIANTMGHSVLIETLREAFYYVNHSNGTGFKCRPTQIRFNESKACYFFVQGTGLQTIIDRFGMLYDGENIRDRFNYLVRHSG